jgi:polysaccharide export outer membrane protein
MAWCLSRFLRICFAIALLTQFVVCQSPESSSVNDSKQKLAELKHDGAPEKARDVASDTSSAPAANVAKGNVGEYRIGEQDLLTVTVWREPELSGTVMVRPDGDITLPLINDVHASGLTPDELKTVLTEKLKGFLNLPQVTVAVREINSRKVFVIGQVGHEGSYRINSTSTVLQVIAEAGGLREFANRKGIYVLRKENGLQTRLKFNYDKVIKGKDPRENILLRPGDTIVVP